MTDTLSQRLLEVSKGLDNQSVLLNSRLSETVKGLDNQSNLLNQRLLEIIRGLDSQSNLLNVKLERLIDSVRNQSHLLNRKIGEVVKALEPLDEKPTTGSRPRRDRIQSAGDSIDWRSQPKPLKAAPEAIRQKRTTANDLEAFRDVFKGIEPWRGYVPPRCIVDFLGMVTDIQFYPMLFTDPSFNADAVGGGYEETAIPQLADAKTAADAEAWFEAADWVIAAREARGRYVMVTLGANYGAQAVGAYRALQTINPMPYKLVAVEPVPANVDWIKQHMSSNGIDPDQHLILPLAVSDSIEPLLFPVGGAGVGANNAFSTNERDARIRYAEEFIAGGSASEALRNLLVNNTTGLMQELVPGHDFAGEIKLISSITLNELLGPFELVDLLESDIQQSEILVFPPFMDVLRRKVRRIHIGTHGDDVHTKLHNVFADNGWEIVFSFRPNSRYQTALGSFETNDGVLTVRNPDL